jgi:hypothetical protein
VLLFVPVAKSTGSTDDASATAAVTQQRPQAGRSTRQRASGRRADAVQPQRAALSCSRREQWTGDTPTGDKLTDDTPTGDRPTASVPTGGSSSSGSRSC